MSRTSCLCRQAVVALLGLITLLCSFASAADGVTRGAMLANSCAACHGTDGRGSGRIPRINDMGKQDLVEEMQEFRSGEEHGTIMDRHAKGYTDEEIGLIADHFNSLKK